MIGGLQIRILKSVQKVPGGIMVIPLLMGVTINTFFPEILMIGNFTTALFKDGASTVIALFLLCNGAQINVKEAGSSFEKGLFLTVVKVMIGAIIGLTVNSIFGIHGIFGLSPLAIIAAITNANKGLYAAMARQYGDSSDVGAVSILAINEGPFITMVILGASGLASISFMSLVACITPMIVGFILGNLDEDMRKFLEKGTVLCIPFFAFPLGANLNFFQIISAGIPGIALGLITTLVTGLGGFFVLKILKAKNPSIGAAIGTTAGNAVATPEAIAAIDPKLIVVASGATVQVAASVIVTAICCPLLVSFIDNINKQKII